MLTFHFSVKPGMLAQTIRTIRAFTGCNLQETKNAIDHGFVSVPTQHGLAFQQELSETCTGVSSVDRISLSPPRVTVDCKEMQDLYDSLVGVRDRLPLDSEPRQALNDILNRYPTIRGTHS